MVGKMIIGLEYDSYVMENDLKIEFSMGMDNNLEIDIERVKLTRTLKNVLNKRLK